MKKIYVLFFACFITVVRVNAQLTRGSWLAGGTISFGYIKVTADNASNYYQSKTTSLEVLPVGGYFVINKLCAGVDVGYNYSHNNFNGLTHTTTDLLKQTGYDNTSGLVLSPFLRYYLLPAVKKVNVIISGQYSYVYSFQHNQEQTVSSNFGIWSASEYKFKSHYHEYAVGGGPVWFLNRVIAAEFIALYTFTQKNNPATGGNYWSVSAGLQIYLGK
ncbi:MAG TPA: hypothetical protein VHB48_14035 [Chitinophagaceae bacterium]|nr:hypothetical protein [Chitinophagaceae bacterium]